MICKCGVEFEKSKKPSKMYPELCPKCRQNKYHLAYVSAHKDDYLQKHRFYHKKYAYGLSAVDFVALYEKQNGKCAICDIQFPPLSERKKLFVVDHNHKTGSVRGLLCQSCNKAIGFFREDESLFIKAVEYILRS